MKKVLVTGANGFVGYWLINELVKHDIEIYAVIKDEKENVSMFDGFKNIHIVYCELENIKNLPLILSEKNFDAVYHLAWVSPGGPGRADYNIQLLNVKYACDLIEAVNVIKSKKVLFAGTITEKISANILNSNQKAQNNIYGLSKHFTHCLIDIECQKYSIDYVWMQFSNLFGPYSVNGNIVGYTLLELLNDRIAKFGPAEQPYDLLYIEDLAYGAYLLGEKQTSKKSYYIGSGDVKQLKEYLYEIGEILGKKDRIAIGYNPDDGTKYDATWFDISALKNDTGYQPRVSFYDGIINTKKWMEEKYLCHLNSNQQR